MRRRLTPRRAPSPPPPARPPARARPARPRAPRPALPSVRAGGRTGGRRVAAGLPSRTALLRPARHSTCARRGCSRLTGRPPPAPARPPARCPISGRRAAAARPRRAGTGGPTQAPGKPGLPCDPRRREPRARPSGRSQTAAAEPANGERGRRHNVERPRNVNTPERAARHVRGRRQPPGDEPLGRPGPAAHKEAPQSREQRPISQVTARSITLTTTIPVPFVLASSQNPWSSRDFILCSREVPQDTGPSQFATVFPGPRDWLEGASNGDQLSGSRCDEAQPHHHILNP
ncbi:translation initiation factor IF-2-like isoform X1 [Alexandromys fortis]|uniref:translation initiation factor IF-2-like isoform X1 n=1 Tax=Alexandromys fortis TaxID=100897 RepID=UPI0021527B49|nr:translation initiation factor IF-2-like isoform X1 [Microtus fortis]